MVKEIYIRSKDDKFYDASILDYTDEVESVISQIMVLLSTNTGDVFGAPHFGIDLEDYVFRTRYSARKITEELDDQIRLYVHHSPNMTINTTLEFGNSGKGYDYGILNIYINGEKSLGFLIDKNNPA